MPTVFYIGATGAVGGAVLADLVGAYPDLKVTALVRNPAHVNAFQTIGVKVVKGSFNDADIITSHARTADITINLGDSDDVGLTTAILAGQTARVTEDHKPPAALLHTSGVAVFADGTTDGKNDPKAKVWNDGDEDDIRSINAKMLHGAIDAQILRAAEKGQTVSYIACPGAVVGPSTGPVPTASLFFRFITEVTLAFKKAIYVGEGSNVFYMVRLDDLVSFYRLLFARILSGEDANASPYSRHVYRTESARPGRTCEGSGMEAPSGGAGGLGGGRNQICVGKAAEMSFAFASRVRSLSLLKNPNVY
jgi:nucleoside-diphosphate-sugar epimerase